MEAPPPPLHHWKGFALEVVILVFAISFLYAFAMFTFQYQQAFTGLAWLVTCGVALVYLVAHRVDRGARTPLNRTHFNMGSGSVPVFKYLGFASLVCAAMAAVLAIADEQGLEPTSWWMTLIASLMCAKWSWLTHRLLSGMQASDEQESSNRAPLVRDGIGEMA
jgi:ABC-type uncharacterized transport system permease subunit